MKTVFLRVLKAEDKAVALLAAIRDPKADHEQRFVADPESFRKLANTSFAYWVGEKVRDLFVRLALVESSGRAARRTNSVDDNFRFARLRWEVTPQSREGSVMWWVPWAKGGSYSSYYYDIDTLICWDRSRGSYPGFLGTPSRPLARPASAQFFFRMGILWPLRSQRGFGPRLLPQGCVFGAKGAACFVDGDAPRELLSLLAIMASSVFRQLVELQTAFGSYEVGVIQRTPVPRVGVADQSELATAARRAWSQKRSLDTRTETSHAFTLPALLQAGGSTLVERSTAWAKRVSAIETELASIQGDVDARCFDLYGIDGADRHAITEGFGTTGAATAQPTELDAEGDAESEPDEPDDTAADVVTLAVELVSWAVGVASGRFDIRLATGERALPPEPEPFDPLPTHSPGMLAEPYPSWRLGTLSAPPAHLVDDPGHTHDLTAAVRAVFDVVFGDAASARWNEAAALLDPKDHDLRNWLGRGFFEHHLKRHSKSRRKAPIVWQLATASSRYAVWLYAHRATKDTFFQVQNDLVAPKLAHEERKHTDLIQTAGPSPTPGARRELDEQATVVEELRTMLDEVKRIAPLWRPDLDDGVVLTMAPLWRLVPQHKAWQKELKAAWEALSLGKYDWSHLAMHLWPERVVPKCQTDRSLAIAHGLEDVFWREDPPASGKWKPRAEPTKSIEALVKERTSDAVRAALKSLLEAPTAGTGGAKRGGGRKKRGDGA